MLNQRIKEFVAPLLEPGERISSAMVGFRPLTRSAALVAVFPAVFGGFAVGSAAGWPAWLAGGIGGGVGGGLAMWLDQRRARREHDGRGMSVGLAVTDRRLFVVEMDTGVLVARPATVEHVAPLAELGPVETEKMQGSGLKRLGVVLDLPGGTELRVIPARIETFMAAVGDG